MELVFRTFARRHSYRWRPTFEDDKARQLWLHDLRRAGLVDADVRRGLDKCAQEEWPPTVGEFIKFCRAELADYGVPEFDDAYLEARRMACRPSHLQQWSHDMVRIAAASVVWSEDGCGLGPDSETRPQFRYAWEILVRRLFAGKPLEGAVPLALPPTIRRCTREVAAKGIASVRRVLNTEDA
ncbi:MAG TPA: replication protein P [Gammaproteobacteria bacterium]|nr:replication protein P [Gammaproteobacteria bacterium]